VLKLTLDPSSESNPAVAALPMLLTSLLLQAYQLLQAFFLLLLTLLSQMFLLKLASLLAAVLNVVGIRN
jgi:hypothetical protein